MRFERGWQHHVHWFDSIRIQAQAEVFQLNPIGAILIESCWHLGPRIKAWSSHVVHQGWRMQIFFGGLVQAFMFSRNLWNSFCPKVSFFAGIVGHLNCLVLALPTHQILVRSWLGVEISIRKCLCEILRFLFWRISLGRQDLGSLHWVTVCNLAARYWV